MNIILFGPPGIGKSTIIGVLKTLGERAIDLEDFYPNRVRFAIPNYLDDSWIGAADLNPGRKYTNAKKVLLALPQEAYERRRSFRDRKFPGKKNQGKHLMREWMKADYDAIVSVKGDKIQVARKLIALMKGGNHAI